jgi:hypothetical protein
MQLAISSGAKCLRTLVTVLAVAFGTQAEAQDRAGVVTTLEGHVTVTRASLPKPAPLKFKDDIFVRDRVATSKDSVARILLGGRAVVTVREHSTVTITEAPGVATVDVAAGRVAVAVAREKMRPGDLVEVRTPNAVAGIRGTVIVAEVFAANHSVVTVLKGTIDVTRLEAGRLVGAATIVNALQRVTIADRAPVSGPQHIAPAAARQLGQEFRLAPPRATPSAATAAVNAGEVARATKDLATLPRGVAVDRRVLVNSVDDDQNEVMQDGRAVPGREKWDKVGKSETGRKGHLETPAVRSYGRAADAVNGLGEATKQSDRSGRGGRDRDR